KGADSVPPPPHPAELAPRSVHKTHPAHFHPLASGSSSSSSTSAMEDGVSGGGAKRTMMRKYKQVSSNEVKRRAIEKIEAQMSGRGHATQDNDRKRTLLGRLEKKSDENEGDDEDDDDEDDEDETSGEDVVSGWTWVDDNDEVPLKAERDDKVSWAERMEVRMRRAKPLFSG
ncbi:hypothetical protein JCM10212_001420, partial [Sporobolomyces blumeae]